MATQDQAKQRGRLAGLLPILGWAPGYKRTWLRPDLIAGVTVAALVIPKALGYAGIAEVPIQNGLYAALAGTILYALFGTCRQISTGPSSAPAAVAGSAVIATSVSGKDAAMLVAAITIGAGAIFVVMRVLKMGWIAQFISKAVIVGFLFGAAIDVTVGELSKLTGTKAKGDNTWATFAHWIGGLGGTSGLTLLVGVLALLALLGLRFFAPKQVPGTLVVVALGILAAYAFNLGAHGVALIGHVPRGLPAPVIPSLSLAKKHITDVAIATVGIVLIGFSQSAGDARHFAFKHGYRVDVDQESLAQGVSNMGAGFFQGIPVSTSLSASSLNDNSGAKSPLSSLATGVMIILTLLFLAPLFSHLPKDVLAAVIIDAVIFGMIDIPAMRRMWRVMRSDFWIAVAAILGVVSYSVLAGVAIGVVLSVFWLIYRTTSPGMPVLGRAPDTHNFRQISEHPDDELFPGVLVLRLDGPLLYVTADALEDRIRELELSAQTPVTAVVLDCESVDFIDSQGSELIGELADRAHAGDISFRLARVHASVMEVLARDGVVERLGADHIHSAVNQAVEAQLLPS